MKITCFLQNAWSPSYAGRTWPRESWLRALHRSRSGQRLKVMVSETLDAWHFDNTTPIVGDCPDSVVPPDPEHIRRVLATTKPDAVVACGRQAAKALQGLGLPKLLIVPHPAHRLLTDSLYRKAGRIICSGFHGTCELRQQKGRVQFMALDNGARLEASHA